MRLRVFECGDVPSIYGSEVDKEHMQAARPAVSLLRGALDVDVGCSLPEAWGFDIDSRVPFAECVVYLWPQGMVEG